MSYPHPKRNFVPKAVLMKTRMRPVNAAKPKAAYNAVKRNRFNDVKASACWVWMPKNRVVDHGRKIDLINEDHFCSDGCTNSGEARVQQRKRRIQRRVQQKQKDQEDEVFGRILSAKKMKTIEELTTAGYRVTITGSRLLMLVRNCPKTSHPSAHKHLAPRAVLMKTSLKSVNTARPVNIVRFVNTGRPFSTARPFRSTVNTVRARGFNVVKPSACWVWRPIKPNGASLSNSQLNDKGFVDSGCSRHMTGNITHLSDFKDFDGGYVTFGGGAYGGRITGKGTIKTNNLDFDDVYFVKELKFNLFSVSQMCDKKNYVLFTDFECLLLSPNFKLPDENQILLKIPRQENMYSFDMKNIVPKDSLTCLVAKATSEESMLWHRRLGHINFKNINTLVKEKPCDNIDSSPNKLHNWYQSHGVLDLGSYRVMFCVESMKKEETFGMQMNAYHRWIDEDIVNHIAKVLEMVALIYVPGVDSHQL
ncbi:ribonuclease H-like domain-containing protein [Tanacetum coccineum]